MNNNTLYLVDNNIMFYSIKHNTIFNDQIPKNIIIDGKIANNKDFFKYFYKFIKKYNLTNMLLTSKINIIVEDNFNYVDKIIIKEILEKLSFKNINIIKSKTLLNFNKDVVYVNYNNEYMIIYYKNSYSRIDILFIPKKVLSLNIIDNFIKELTKNKKVYLFGNNHKIREYNISKNQYYIDEPTTYLINSIYKV